MIHESTKVAVRPPPLRDPHTLSDTEALDALGPSVHGLSRAEAAARLAQYGRNNLPRAPVASIGVVFLRQFLSPLIYVLLMAAVISCFLQEWSDAGFIGAVLLINAIIGTIQEYSAQRSAEALRSLVSTRARVLREGDAFELDAEELAPGDIVLLGSGSKVPADLRLLTSQGLEVDESLLTGESLPVAKDPETRLPVDALIAERINMAFAGTMVARGRSRGIVVATGTGTQIGQLASAVLGEAGHKPPLQVRMEKFTLAVAGAIVPATLLLAAVELTRGTPLHEIFFVAVALAVSAIPEGLPVALTVALAIGMRRMARRHVIVRRLVAVEALGSCTFVASDKTGTLTVNELTARRLALLGQGVWEVTGEGTDPEGLLLGPQGARTVSEDAALERMCRAAVLCNEAFLGHRNGAWTHDGDAVDVALLVLGHKAGLTQAEAQRTYPLLAEIPFESERQYCATLHRGRGSNLVVVKGALERLLPMCTRMATSQGDADLDRAAVEAEAQGLARDGYRVLALAERELAHPVPSTLAEPSLQGLILLGLVGMIDPLRPEVKAAVGACRRAGLQVSMVTGDHPVTALAIARELGLATDMEQVVSGHALRQAEMAGATNVDGLTARARLFARVEPRQKLTIVESLARNGHFVAVTGDGANDAPALRAAHVGVAMGKSGTDVARESADLIVTDDNFASIVAGIEEGRVAYANVRKVIFLLISTGAAEIVLFFLSLAAGLPLPLLAVQLLWLNLVTNGIQDVALAFEPAEGDEMERPPRPPAEPIFNRVMVARVILSALVIGVLAFLVFRQLMASGVPVAEARNSTLLLMVLFENVHVFNSRSERRSALRQSPLQNPLLLFGTAAAQLVHIGAMYTPGLRDVLALQPVSFGTWLELLGLALGLLAVMEAHKLLRRWWDRTVVS